MDTNETALLERANVDVTNLVVEWKNQPKRIFAAELLAVDANLDVAKAKMHLEWCEADLNKQFRAFGIKTDDGLTDIKVTEGSIQAGIRTDKEWITRAGDLQAKQHRLEILRAVLNMEKTRITALKYITTITNPFKSTEDDDPDRVAVEHRAQEAVQAHLVHATGGFGNQHTYKEG